MITVTRYKVWEWINLRDNSTFFGIAAKVDKNWLPVRDANNPLFFKTRDEAQTYVNHLNNPVKQPSNEQQ